MTFKQIILPYAEDALEPYIDATTMNIHYNKHHAGYTSKLNAAVAGTMLADQSIEEILKNVSKHSAAIRNNGGGFYNHNLFWESMSPDGGSMPSGELLDAIQVKFGSFDQFREKFSDAAATRFGSGWAWLIVKNGNLEISSTPNQDNPLMDVVEMQGEPILGLDVWEHAYYLKYQNKRPDYIEAFFKVINWKKVSEKYNKAK